MGVCAEGIKKDLNTLDEADFVRDVDKSAYHHLFHFEIGGDNPCSQQLSERTRLSAGYLHYSNPHSALQQMLVMKSISQLDINLPRVVIVKPSERHTVIQKDAAISHIQSSHGNAIFLREAFPE